MGFGDNIMATGMARGAYDRGKQVAFGNGRKIIWDNHSEIIFRGNPNIAKPGAERRRDLLEWIEHYKGRRAYNRHDAANRRWVWNYEFQARPGEIFLSERETRFGDIAKDCIVIEPNVPKFKSVAANKQWPVARYDAIVSKLIEHGHHVIQLQHLQTTHRSPGARIVTTQNIRHAMAMLKSARLYIGPEGGLHHAAAAFQTRAVVLFGGFVPPSVTGYYFHVNLTGGAEACGSLYPCKHCAEAMNRISVDEVLTAAQRELAA